ncbi:MAG: hypothetical protein K6U04_06030 [Armatimonadetes bacterium]|nr:hypothetical protein [Armatimonadota bacterium]
MQDKPDSLKKAVREKYAELARLAREQGKGSCCAPAGTAAGFCCAENYTPGEITGLPPELLAASLGCGNPAALAVGALTAEEYRHLLVEAGFAEIGLEVTRVFSRADFPEGLLTEKMEKQLAPYAGSLVSAFVRARKPRGKGEDGGR